MAKQIKEIIENEVRKFQRNWGWYLVGFVLFMVVPYVHYYLLDGNLYNRVLTYTNGVDPMAMETDKTSYCPGERLLVKTSFCKNREVEGYEVNWWQSNGQLVNVRNESSTKVLPVGCYPSDEQQTTLSYRFTIPEDSTEGWHVAYGVTNHFLSGARRRSQEYKTEPYYVEDAASCTPDPAIVDTPEVNIISPIQLEQ